MWTVFSKTARFGIYRAVTKIRSIPKSRIFALKIGSYTKSTALNLVVTFVLACNLAFERYRPVTKSSLHNNHDHFNLERLHFFHSLRLCMIDFYILSNFKMQSCLFNLLTQFNPGRWPVKVSFPFLAWAFPGHAQNGQRSHQDMTNINFWPKIISQFQFWIPESEITKIFQVRTHLEHVLLPRFFKKCR